MKGGTAMEVTTKNVVVKHTSGRPRSRPDDDLILKLYGMLTSVEISKMYGVSPSTVRSWVRRAKNEGVAIE